MSTCLDDGVSIREEVQPVGGAGVLLPVELEVGMGFVKAQVLVHQRKYEVSYGVSGL